MKNKILIFTAALALLCACQKPATEIDPEHGTSEIVPISFQSAQITNFTKSSYDDGIINKGEEFLAIMNQRGTTSSRYADYKSDGQGKLIPEDYEGNTPLRWDLSDKTLYDFFVTKYGIYGFGYHNMNKNFSIPELNASESYIIGTVAADQSEDLLHYCYSDFLTAFISTTPQKAPLNLEFSHRNAMIQLDITSEEGYSVWEPGEESDDYIIDVYVDDVQLAQVYRLKTNEIVPKDVFLSYERQQCDCDGQKCVQEAEAHIYSKGSIKTLNGRLCIIPPQKCKPQIRIVFKSGLERAYVSKTDIDFLPNKKYSLNLTISKDVTEPLQINMSTVVSDWDSNIINCTVPDNATPSYVDLGLSVDWGSWNLGATKPEGLGYYYAWGEHRTYYRNYMDPTICLDCYTENGYSWNSYLWYHDSEIYCYNNSPEEGLVDGRTVLRTFDDIAYLILGKDWHTPTASEWQELIDNTIAEQTSINGVNGLRLTSTVPGYVGKSIFLPYSPIIVGTSFSSSTTSGSYWSSSLSDTNGYTAKFARASDKLYFDGSQIRYFGLNIRPVHTAPESIPSELCGTWYEVNKGENYYRYLTIHEDGTLNASYYLGSVSDSGETREYAGNCSNANRYLYIKETNANAWLSYHESIIHWTKDALIVTAPGDSQGHLLARKQDEVPAYLNSRSYSLVGSWAYEDNTSASLIFNYDGTGKYIGTTENWFTINNYSPDKRQQGDWLFIKSANYENNYAVFRYVIKDNKLYLHHEGEEIGHFYTSWYHKL